MLVAMGVDVGGDPFGEALAEEAADGFVGVAAGLFVDDDAVVEREHFRGVFGYAEDEEAEVHQHRWKPVKPVSALESKFRSCRMFAEEPKQGKAVARKARVEFRDAAGKVVAEGGCGSQTGPHTPAADPRPGRPHGQPATASPRQAAALQRGPAAYTRRHDRHERNPALLRCDCRRLQAAPGRRGSVRESRSPAR